MAFTLKKLIDGTSNWLNRDTWHPKKKKKKLLTPSYSFPWTAFMDKGATDGESKMHKSYFVHMGRPWEKTGEMGRVEHARPQ